MGNNSRKFYYGDKVKFVPSRHTKYTKHWNHQGFVIGTSIHIKDNNRYATYQVECFCGQALEPKSMDLDLVQARGLEEDQEPTLDKRRRYFLTQLSIDPEDEPVHLAKQVNYVLRVLSDKYKGVVMDRFGLNTDHEFRLTHTEIGRGLNPPVTKQRTQQIERRAFEMMRNRA